ncbi:hypothetical protein CHS0354_001111 [Potamilus streckersoni]|uniref:Transmembrane protein 9 n=1 Tax=Potamilus streckersoni TaxID=2493646 RepID=A0AAE0RWC8_9BIVA|nr:hypothetical protein CHS0354_001111 [Potamilus streckersoni]
MATFSNRFLVLYIVLSICAINISLVDSSEQTSFEDARCKCICPAYKANVNSTLPKRNVFIKDNIDPELCKCDYMLDKPDPKLCLLCQCKYESRNTTTIKVVVIIVICIISVLFVYMLFLLCLDPLITRRPTHYQEHTNEEVNLDDQSVTRMPLSGGRQRSIINRVTDEQKKWKGVVQEQRRNIYDKHSMLN